MSGSMFEERFVKLVEDNGGFEYYQAYRGDVDLILGGKGNTFWYVVMKKGKVTESYIGKNSTGVWEDICIKGTGANKKAKTMPSGSTIRRICCIFVAPSREAHSRYSRSMPITAE